MFSRRSREERETGGASERCPYFGRLSFIDEAKARLRRFVENPKKKKKKTKRNARRDVYRNTSVSSCTECPGAYPAYTMFPFLYSLSLSLSPPRNNRRCSFFLRVCVVLSSKCRYISARKKKKEFSLCFVALRLW